MAAEQQVSVYDALNLFPVGTAHHAAETGSLEEMDRAEAANKERGYPVSVTLETRDDILQCVPLHVAAEKGKLNVVEYLVKHGVDLDAADGHGVRPLHLAAITNRLDIVNLLINKGANPTKQDNEGDVPLHWAATKGHVEMMELLMDRGSAADAPNKQGWTALHRAAYTGYAAACRLMLRRGAGLNAVTREGRTALHLAALQNQLGVMELLLNMGAGTHFRDSQGATAADHCISDTARGLIQERMAAHLGNKLPSGSVSRPISSTSAAAKQAPQKPAISITHVPEMPRFRPAHNTNLDADGFPVALQARAEDLQGGPSAGDLESTDTVPMIEPLEVTLEQQQQQLLGEIPAFVASSQPSLVSYQEPIQQQSQLVAAGQLSSSSSFGKTSGRFAAAVGDTGAADQEWLQQGAALLAPQQKAPGPNRRFLNQYGLHRMGLFAP